MPTYNIQIPLTKETIKSPQFGFLHPAMIYSLSRAVGVADNNYQTPTKSFFLCVPDPCKIIAPVTGIIEENSYQKDIPTHSNELAHKCNYLTIRINKETTVKIEHMRSPLTVGTTVSKGQDIGELFGYLGEYQEIDAHLHMKISGKGARMKLEGIPEGWRDWRREFTSRCLDGILDSSFSRREAEKHFQHNQNLRRQVKEATLEEMRRRL